MTEPEEAPDGGVCAECERGLPSWQQEGLCARCLEEIARESNQRSDI